MDIISDFKYENILPFEETATSFTNNKTVNPVASNLTSKKNDAFLLSEINASFGKEVHYVQPTDQKVLVPVSMESSTNSNIQDSIRNFLWEIFLPQGYPSSVSEDYTSYQIWDTTQAFCSTITGILATQAVMKGVGVGNVEATPLAATITWVIKDGTGHIGRIAFAWWKGTSLDADCKKWRLVADVLNDAALCLELALPMFGGYTTVILCISTVMKAIVGVSGGATRAALIQHQSVRGNLADVAAKDGSQETATNLIASLAAIVILSVCDQFIWPLFFLFTSLHIFSNYRAVKSVCLQKFNSSRYLITIMIYLQHKMFVKPSFVNAREPVFFFENNITEENICGYKINVGNSIKNLVASEETSLNDMNNAICVFKHSKYLLIVNSKMKNICIVLDKSASSEDTLCSYFHAVVYGILLSANDNRPLALLSDSTWHSQEEFQSFRKSMKDTSETSSIEFCQKIQDYVTKEWGDFSDGLKNTGWRLNQCLILSGEWRGQWTHGDQKNE